jgi:hypothetical protein
MFPKKHSSITLQSAIQKYYYITHFHNVDVIDIQNVL